MEKILHIAKTLATYGLLPIVVLFFVGLLYTTQSNFSPVYDELANIPAAYNLLETNRYPDPSHPPLYRYLYSIPLYALGTDALADDPNGHTKWKSYGKRFLFDNTVPWQKILRSVRLVNILFGAVLLTLLFFFCKKKWGIWAASAALLFLAFEPSFLAFSALATLDLAHCLTYFLGALSIERYLKKPSSDNFWLLHLGLAVAFLSKFSALPLFFVAIIGVLLFRKRQGIALKGFWLSPLIFAALIFMAYRFQVKKPAEDRQITEAVASPKAAVELAKWEAQYDVQSLMQTNIPAYDFWKGFGMQVFHSIFQDKWQKESSFQYLDGAYSRRGWRHYFVCTFLWKSTLASLAFCACLLAFGIALVRKDFKQAMNPTAFTMLAAPLFLFFACSMSTINIGHRYILPVYPFIAIGIAFLVAYSRKFKPALFILLLAHVGSSLIATPHHLSYFNELARNRYRLADSNIDWGQDLLYLQADWEKNKSQYGANIWGDCFGLVQPADMGISMQAIPTTESSLSTGKHILYLSVNPYLNRSSVNPEGLYPWLLNKKVARTVGTSILVYEIDVKE